MSGDMRYDNACRLSAEWPPYMRNAGKQQYKARATAGKDDPSPGEHAIVHHVIIAGGVRTLWTHVAETGCRSGMSCKSLTSRCKQCLRQWH